MEEFKVGKTYKLLDDKVNRFFFTSDIRDLVDLQPEAKNHFHSPLTGLMHMEMHM